MGGEESFKLNHRFGMGVDEISNRMHNGEGDTPDYVGESQINDLLSPMVVKNDIGLEAMSRQISIEFSGSF